MALVLRYGRWSATWPLTLLTAVAVVCFVSLGRWQWHRADAKRALAVAFAAGNASAQALGDRPTAALPRYAHVRVEGSYDPAHQFLLENLSHEGNPGYQVLTPLRLSDGRTLMVNRGWLPLTRSRRDPPQVGFDASATGVAVSGKLDALPVAGLALGRQPPAPGADWPKLTSFPTMNDLSAALGAPLESQQLLLDAQEPQGYLRDWHMGGLGPERHIAYAVQWWAFAVLALALFARLNWQRR